MAEIAMKSYCLSFELGKLGSEALFWYDTNKEFSFLFLKEQLFMLREI